MINAPMKMAAAMRRRPSDGCRGVGNAISTMMTMAARPSERDCETKMANNDTANSA